MLLLDEIEKAHPDVFNILLQILEDGRLTDSQGRTVDFRHAIVIMTSNIGASEIARNTPLGFAVSDDETGITYDDMKLQDHGRAEEGLPPRVPQPHRRRDRLPQAAAATRSSRSSSCCSGVSASRWPRRELQLELTDEAKDLLVDKGWDPSMGARPLRRAIQRYIEDPLADFVLRAQLTPGATVLVERAPEGEEPEVSISIIEPAPQPVAVGAAGADSDEEVAADEPEAEADGSEAE